MTVKGIAGDKSVFMVINALLFPLIHSHIGRVGGGVVCGVPAVCSRYPGRCRHRDQVQSIGWLGPAMARPAWPYSDKMAAAEIQHREHPASTAQHHYQPPFIVLGPGSGLGAGALCVWGQ